MDDGPVDTAQNYVNAAMAALAPLAEAKRAASMAAYMQDHFAFLGIPAPARRAAIKPLAKPDGEDVPAIVRSLWLRNEREYHYVALDLLDAMAKKLDPSATIALIEDLVLENSWWDSVDGFAAIASTILRRNVHLRDVVWRWSAHASFWMNRLAILHQNGWGHETDSAILFQLCRTHCANREFFIRKAIGWALRDYAWVNPLAVRGFVEQNRASLSPLSVREALKNVGKAGA